MNIRVGGLVAAASLALTGCGGGSGSGSPAAGPAIPTVLAVELDAAQQRALEPLADGALWTYQCDSGATPQLTAKHFGSVAGADTFVLASTFPVGRASSAVGSVVLAHTSEGQLSYYGFVKNGVFTKIPQPVVLELPSPTTGWSATFPDQGGGTITSVFQTLTTVDSPSGSYAKTVLFHNTYSKNPDLSLDFYDARGIGTVRIDYANGITHDRCLLASTNLIAGH